MTMGWNLNLCSDLSTNTSLSTENRPYYSCALIVYVEPVVCSLGFILNCVCISIFISVNNKGYFRKISLVVYLITLCSFNALQLLLSILVLVLPAAEEYIRQQYPDEALILRRVNVYTVRLGYPFLLSCNYATVWMITLICVQRYQAVCHPSSVWRKRLQNVRNSKTSISVIVFAAIGLNVIRFWELEWRVNGNETHVVDSYLKSDTVYNLVQEGIVYGLMAYALPTLLLVILNVNIVSTIYRTSSHKFAATTEDRAMQKNEHRNALMTLTIFVVFFMCNTLAVTLRVQTILAPEVGAIYEDWVGWFLMDLSNFLVNVNSLLNPLVYFCFTRRFRDLFFEIRRGRLSTVSSSSRASVFSQLQHLTGRTKQTVVTSRRGTRHESLTPLHHGQVRHSVTSGRRQLRTMVSSYM